MRLLEIFSDVITGFLVCSTYGQNMSVVCTVLQVLNIKNPEQTVDCLKSQLRPSPHVRTRPSALLPQIAPDATPQVGSCGKYLTVIGADVVSNPFPLRATNRKVTACGPASSVQTQSRRAGLPSKRSMVKRALRSSGFPAVLVLFFTSSDGTLSVPCWLLALLSMRAVQLQAVPPCRRMLAMPL